MEPRRIVRASTLAGAERLTELTGARCARRPRRIDFTPVTKIASGLMRKAFLVFLSRLLAFMTHLPAVAYELQHVTARGVRLSPALPRSLHAPPLTRVPTVRPPGAGNGQFPASPGRYRDADAARICAMYPLTDAAARGRAIEATTAIVTATIAAAKKPALKSDPRVKARAR